VFDDPRPINKIYIQQYHENIMFDKYLYVKYKKLPNYHIVCYKELSCLKENVHLNCAGILVETAGVSVSQ